MSDKYEIRIEEKKGKDGKIIKVYSVYKGDKLVESFSTYEEAENYVKQQTQGKSVTNSNDKSKTKGKGRG